jgi:hypothetical protein
MSGQILANANQANLNSTEKSVIMDWVQDADSYSACPRVISERTGILIRHVKAALNGLVDKGVLIKSESKVVSTTGGLQKMTVYEAKGVLPEALPEVKGGASRGSKGVLPQAPKGVLPEAPIPIKEPSKELSKRENPLTFQNSLNSNPQEVDSDTFEILDNPDYLEQFNLLPEEAQLEVRKSTNSDDAKSLFKKYVNIHLTKSIEICGLSLVVDNELSESCETYISKTKPNTLITKENEMKQTYTLSEIVTFWKSEYGTGLECVSSKVMRDSISALCATLRENEISNFNPERVADIIFGKGKLSPKVVSWKGDVIAKLNEAWILSSPDRPTIASPTETKAKYAGSTGPTENYKFNTPGAKALYDKHISEGKEPHSMNGSVVEYYEQRAYACSFPLMSIEQLQKLSERTDDNYDGFDIEEMERDLLKDKKKA